jgi:DNA repair exonuclease SbcCD ATPase subunit
MGTENVIRNSGSAVSMACPKCGFEQEERLDCRKCGVVFSKYQSLYSSARSASGNGSSNAQEPSEQQQKVLIADLQLQVKELSSKICEIEFEKAERSRLQRDLKDLDRKLQTGLEDITARFEQAEKRFDEMSTPKPQEGLNSNLLAFEDRLRRVEDRLENLVHINHKFDDILEKYGINLQQILEIRDQVSALQKEFVETKSQMDLLKDREPEPVESKVPIEEEVRAIICRYLDEFRQLLSAAGQNN